MTFSETFLSLNHIKKVKIVKNLLLLSSVHMIMQRHNMYIKGDAASGQFTALQAFIAETLS